MGERIIAHRKRLAKTINSRFRRGDHFSSDSLRGETDPISWRYEFLIEGEIVAVTAREELTPQGAVWQRPTGQPLPPRF
jgi:hypothetical protein